ncbi:MAG: hypothetical protein K0Q87_2705 [Neobacillus sp.]|nr:hypothetical protein [Neobacillus sp.]
MFTKWLFCLKINAYPLNLGRFAHFNPPAWCDVWGIFLLDKFYLDLRINIYPFMKSPFKVALLVVLISVFVISMFSIIAFLPSFSEVFNFTDKNKGSISTVINNIATPCISLVSIILLFITLNKQEESILDQRKSKNLDLILTSFNNLETEYNSFTHVKRGTKMRNGERIDYEQVFHGFDALEAPITSVTNNPKKFGMYYTSDKYISIIATFEFVNDLILTLDLDPDIKSGLIYKIDTFYQSKLKVLFLQLSYVIKDNTDINSKKIVTFITNQERKNYPDFDLKNYSRVGDLFTNYENPKG